MLGMTSAAQTQAEGAEARAFAERVRKENVAISVVESLEHKMKQPGASEKFGGLYINDEGSLVINVTEKDPVFDVANATVNIVKYSYQQLKNIHDRLLELAQGSAKVPISFIAIDDRNNQVIIGIPEMKPEIVQLISKAVDVGAIKIVHETGKPIDFSKESEPTIEVEESLDLTLDMGVMSSTIIYPGNRVEGTLQNELGLPYKDYSTLGFRAQRNGVDGFVTTYHGKAMGTTDGVRYYTQTWTPVGTVKVQSNSNGVDACWVELKSGVSLQRQFMNGEMYSGIMPLHVQGMSVSMFGGYSGKTTGFIEYTSASWPEKPEWNDSVAATFYAQPGDSGSAVVRYIQSGSEPPELLITGMLVGQAPVNGQAYRIYNKADKIMTRLGLSGW